MASKSQIADQSKSSQNLLQWNRYLWYIGLLILVLASIGPLYYWFQHKKQQALAEKIASNILKEMSLAEQVGQRLHIGVQGPHLSRSEEKMLQSIQPGGIILFKRNLLHAPQLIELTHSLQNNRQVPLKIPRLISIDQEGGRVQRIPEPIATHFPAALSIGLSQNEELAYLSAFITGAQMRALGIQLVLAPVLDINNNPANPVINTRSFGSDANTVASIGEAYTRGALEIRSGPVIKHFPGHGDTDTDSHLQLPRISHSLAELEKNELIPFKRSIAAGAPMVMVAHISFPDLDPEYPASLSKKILQQLLRQKMGFKGLIMTDALEMKAIADRYTVKKTARMAIEAGADILLFADLPRNQLLGIHKYLIGLYESGELDRAELEKSVKRQLLYKLHNALWQSEAHQDHHIHDLYQNPQINQWFTKYDELDPFQAEIKLHNKLSEIEKTPAQISSQICEASIVSLEKPFNSIAPGQAHLFYNSPVMKAAAIISGMQAHQIQPGGLGALSQWLKKKSSKAAPSGQKSYLLLEFDESTRKRWNRIAEKWSPPSKSTQLIGLYTGNPFLNIKMPKIQGGVLMNASHTRDCRTALLKRALGQRGSPLISPSPLPTLKNQSTGSE